MPLVLNKIPKFIDSDYDPIPHTDPKWLPKEIKKEYKSITAKARQATRLGCEIREPAKFDPSTYKGRVRGNYAKYLIACCKSDKTAKKKYEGKLLTAGQADINKFSMKMRYRHYYLELYTYRFQRILIKHQYNGVFPKPKKTIK